MEKNKSGKKKLSEKKAIEQKALAPKAAAARAAAPKAEAPKAAAPRAAAPRAAAQKAAAQKAAAQKAAAQKAREKKPAEGRRNGKDSLPFDLEIAIEAIAKSDRAMAKLIKNVGPCKLQVQSMQSCYETLLESIVYQQLTGKAAATILGRVKALYGDGFPSPEEVLSTENQTLRDAGLSGAKTAAIKDLSEKASAGFLPGIEEMHELSDEEIVEILSTVRGIGEWTVQMMLIFRLGRTDVMPCNDYGVRKGFARTYELDELPSPKQLLQHAEKWRPYRTIASWYLWRSLEL